MIKKDEIAPVVWGSETPVEGKTYSFSGPIKAKSSPFKKTWKEKDEHERKFIDGKFNGETPDGKLKFTGHKFIGDLDNRDFDLFILQMRRNGASGARIRNVISAVKSLISFLSMGSLLTSC